MAHTAPPRPQARSRRAVAGSGRERDPQTRRKLVEFDGETWLSLDLLRRDTFATFQELADEAFRDLLKKHHRPLTLRHALRQSARDLASATKPRRSAATKPG
jgi:hypothetical protein